MVDRLMSILAVTPARNWSEAVAVSATELALTQYSGARTGSEPRQSSEPTVSSAGMERAYLRMLQAKEKLASTLQVPGDVIAARALAGQIARQVAAAAQEYVSLGGRSSALLEPALPVTNNGKPIPLGDTGFKAYEAANSAVKSAAANDTFAEDKTQPSEPAGTQTPPAPKTVAQAAEPAAAPVAKPAPAPQPASVPEFAGGLSLKV